MDPFQSMVSHSLNISMDAVVKVLQVLYIAGVPLLYLDQ